MKMKLFALIACILMTGTAGAFAKNSDTNTVPNTANSTVEVQEKNTVSDNSQLSTVQKISDTTLKYDGKLLNAKSVNSDFIAGIFDLTGTDDFLANTINSKANCTVNSKACNSSTPTKTPSTPTKTPSTPTKTPSTPTKTPSTPTKTPSTPTKTPSTPTKTPSTSSQISGNYSSFQQQVLQLVNKERAAYGLKALTMNDKLTKTATLKSEDIARLNYFSHTSPTYGSPFDMMKQFGIRYRSAGENIARGQRNPEEVMQGWMNSPGHRANILNSSFTQIGVGIAKNSRGQYVWTQQFIG